MGSGDGCADGGCAGETVSGLPWRDRLERFFQEDLGAVQVITGPGTDVFLSRYGLAAAACGERIRLSGDLLLAGPSACRQVLAHEVAHVLQQTRGARWAGRSGDGVQSLEREARAVGAAFGAGRPRPARTASSRPLGSRVQGHDSFEHRLLGDAPTQILGLMVAGQGTSSRRQQALEDACEALAYLGLNAANINQAKLNQAAGYPVQLVRLQGSGLQVTYGELNAMADYVTCPAEIDALPQNVMLPILQMIREGGYVRLNALRTPPGPPCPFDSLLQDTGSDTLDSILESQTLDNMTAGLGQDGRDHYLGNLARNACHFAPFTWWRWQANYAIAVVAAQAAYQANRQPELVRQAWLKHGYADHFLQDSFAAGHLINKTLIMQWFVDWAAGQDHLPVYDWDALKTITFANQPNLWGSPLYSPAFSGMSNDPQTSEEQASQAARMASTGILAGGGQTQQQAYLSYLAFLDSLVCQAVTRALHDLLNARSVTASSPQAQDFVIWGDATMLNGGTGAGLASAAAQMSQQSLKDILLTGSTAITWQQIFASFPNQVLSNGSMISLPQWHAVGGELWNLCHSDQVFDSWTTLHVGTGSHITDMGIVSVDQPASGAFQPTWQASQPAGWLTTTQPAACDWNGSCYVFYLPAGGSGLAGVKASSPADLALIALPPTGSFISFAAGVLGGQLTVVYVNSANGTLTALTSTDGSTWTATANFAGVTGANWTLGVAIAQVGSFQYVMFGQGSGDDTSLSYMVNDGAGWSAQPIPVPGSSFGSNPALATDGQTLYVAFQHGSHGIYTGQLAGTVWTGPASRPGILTTAGVSLAYVNGTLYLGYWAVNGQLHAESWSPATQQWTELAVPPQQSICPVTITGMFSEPVLLFGHGFASGQAGALAWVDQTAGTWSTTAYALGLFYSDTTPLLLEFAGATQAFITVNDAIYQHTYDGTSWSAPVPVTVISAGAGRLGGEVRIGGDDTETLWLAAVQPGGETLAATFDGTTWTGLPIIAGPEYGTGAIALVEYNDQLYAFYEHSELLQVSVFDDAAQRWAIMGPVPGVSYPQSTCVTIAGDLLYVSYLCADPSTTTTPSYLVAFDGEEWLAPVVASTDNASGSSIAGFIDQVIQVYLGTNGIMYGQWTGSGGAAWHGKTALGAAFTAPGLLPVSTAVGDDTHAQGLLGLASWSGAYNGLFAREMTTPLT